MYEGRIVGGVGQDNEIGRVRWQAGAVGDVSR